MSNKTRLPYRYDAALDLDLYEYQTTEGQRKCWDGEPDLSEEGWEEWAEWERFEYTEERYWRRPLNEEQIARRAESKERELRLARLAEREQAVIEAAEAWLAAHRKKYDHKLWYGEEDDLHRALEALKEARDE